ncbi:PP2C family protein-serine/threonine phosphatase [Rhodococcus sp. NPDC057297]|uniref:PP2C family protein-serine/threonine phosphatase n=1 Tax=Rhodococcus sp. NPDC057297 TaxID=3346090 RepID=UPI0036351B58
MPADTPRFLDTAPAGYLAIRASSQCVVYANATVCRTIGRAPSDVVGRRVHDLFADSSADTVTALLTASPDAGTETPIGATADLLTGPDSVLSMLVMANRDIQDDDSTIRFTLHSATSHRIREQTLIEARDGALTAQATTADALTRSQDALEAAEDARKVAEAERTQIQILATTLQRTLLPPVLSSPPGTDVAAYYHHAVIEEVGGDFYDVFPLDESTWGFFLGDVSGKGPGAAAVTSLTRYTLRAAAVFDRDPITVLQNLNTVLYHEFRGDDPRFCTVLFGTITPAVDEKTTTIRLASGGHPPALHLRADGSAEYIDTIGGQLVGALRTAQFRAADVILKAGDVLLLYTDGLTEAHVGPGKARYDDAGALETFANDAAPTTAARIVDDLVGLLNSFGSGLQDDVAVLALGAP